MTTETEMSDAAIEATSNDRLRADFVRAVYKMGEINRTRCGLDASEARNGALVDVATYRSCAGAVSPDRQRMIERFVYSYAAERACATGHAAAAEIAYDHAKAAGGVL